MPTADSSTEAVDPSLMRAHARVGTTLRGKWHLDVLLGLGGMAAVYAATHRNGTRAAIKVLHPELSVHSHIRSRFFREGRVANTVGHDGAVKVLDEDEDERGSIYLVMELLDGESLDARAARAGGKLPIDEVLAAADQLLDVLIAAHSKGVIHRDLKPENVFLTRDGRVMVLDFGIARLRELSTQSHATRDGSTMGTPAFMAPEQARGLWDEVDARADLWAVGATMFALMTGHPVHDGRTTNEVLVAAVTQTAAPLASVLPDVPEPVAALVDRGLAFEKAERWPDAKTMQDALRHAFHSMHGEPISSQKLSVPHTVPNRTLPSAGVALPESPRGDRTSAAVVAGQSGVPLHASNPLRLPPGALIAGVVVVAGAVVALFIVAASFIGSRNASAPSANAATTTSNAAVGAPPTSSAPPVLAPAAKPDASAAKTKKQGPGVISIDELPTAAPSKKPVSAAPAVKATAYVPPPSWKEQRK